MTDSAVLRRGHSRSPVPRSTAGNTGGSVPYRPETWRSAAQTACPADQGDRRRHLEAVELAPFLLGLSGLQPDVVAGQQRTDAGYSGAGVLCPSYQVNQQHVGLNED
ncbi:MAG: hypothetical protein MZV70_10825, partial [Desulfobacterales bacterium]|nr:hypothetical protein [Desulfobacterales bacterium]